MIVVAWLPIVVAQGWGSGRGQTTETVYQTRGDAGINPRREHSGRERRPGPQFCQSGTGHPVFGMRWCYERGYVYRAPRWEERQIADIVFRSRPTRPSERLERSVLEEILGRPALARLEREAGVAGTGLLGRWIDTGEGRTLQLEANGLPMLRLTDRNEDGRVDAVLLNRDLSRDGAGRRGPARRRASSQFVPS